MVSGITILCFAASYAIALALELYGLRRRPRWHRLAVGVATGAGLLAQTLYLGRRAADNPAAPLSSPHDWYLVAAWLVIVVCLAGSAYYPRRSLGLFLLPAALGLIGAATLASTEQLASFEAPRFWGRLHGAFLAFGTAAVLVGFVAGLMYLIQSWRLKHKAPQNERFQLPSLEWLEAVNSRALDLAVVLVTLGFFTGVLVRVARRGDAGVPWSDPVVLSLAAMVAWLLLAQAFRWVYPAARHGQKVAYLTMASLTFLVITLAAFGGQNAVHGGDPVDAGSGQQAGAPAGDSA